MRKSQDRGEHLNLIWFLDICFLVESFWLFWKFRLMWHPNKSKPLALPCKKQITWKMISIGNHWIRCKSFWLFWKFRSTCHLNKSKPLALSCRKQITCQKIPIENHWIRCVSILYFENSDQCDTWINQNHSPYSIENKLLEPLAQRTATPENKRQVDEQQNQREESENTNLTRFGNCLHSWGRRGERSY